MPDHILVCPVCPHACRLGPGEQGLCRARANRGGNIVPLAQNLPCAIQIDPVEKKPLFHFFPGSPILSLGMAGCNLRCRNCQNASISQRSPEEVPGTPLTPEDVAALMEKHGLSLVAYTYTEPLVAFEYVLDCARKVREAGGRNVLVTAAYARKETLRSLLPFIDAANVDLKAMSDAFYQSNCGASLSFVLDALRLFAAAGVCLEITNLIIPGLNDKEEELRLLARFVRDELGEEVPLHFSRFFPSHKLRSLPPTPETTLIHARDIAFEEGLRHVYLGNTAQPETTSCAACGQPLLTRRGYLVTDNKLAPGGRCPACGAFLYGRF